MRCCCSRDLISESESETSAWAKGVAGGAALVLLIVGIFVDDWVGVAVGVGCGR